jgi:Flp pilus assembly protein TadG
VAVEFAILLPILITILFGTVAFGLALARLEAYTSAAREGARYVAVHCAPDHTNNCQASFVLTRIQQAAAPNAVTTAPSVSILDCRTSPGTPTTVSWSQPISIQIPPFINFTVTPTVSGSFRCE